MKEFFDLFTNLAENEIKSGNMKDSLNGIIQGLDKAKEWLKKIDEKTFDDAIMSAGKHTCERLADMVRDGTINQEYLEQMHRLRMTLPSNVTRKLEETINLFYKKYKHEAGTKKKEEKSSEKSASK